MNQFTNLLDVASVKALVEKAQNSKSNEDKYLILLPHYSINIQSQYEDGEECDNDWNDFEDAIGAQMEVSDFDDLVIDLTEEGETFEYYINTDERGEFRADVRNAKDETVFDVNANTLEDGFMNHKNDIKNLREYLIQLEIMGESDTLIKGN